MMNREEQLAEILGWLPTSHDHTRSPRLRGHHSTAGRVATIRHLPPLTNLLLVALVLALLALALLGFAGAVPAFVGGDTSASIPQSDTAQSGPAQSETAQSGQAQSGSGAFPTSGNDTHTSPASGGSSTGVREDGSDATPSLVPPLRNETPRPSHPSWFFWGEREGDAEENSPTEQADPSVGYQFLSIAPTGRPMLYSRCMPITVAVNPDGLPAEGPSIVSDTVGQLGELTGLTFELLDNPAQLDEATVTIHWETLKQNPALSGALGRGGSTAVYSLTDPHGHLVRGKISLNADMPEVWTEQPITARGVLLHEFGHVLGLGHVPTTDTIMAPQASERMTLSDGDRTGFHAVGQGRCWEKGE